MKVGELILLDGVNSTLGRLVDNVVPYREWLAAQAVRDSIEPDTRRR